ncbi:hypothetical protein BKA58DRAFT_440970 [Alternaria rosae]|uniref:uncharacterized protein n=1 Tax=Alternaria rosae TaxID=1187941 RepID=UPI001E8E6EF9|nr:uncharacterized protein BKA58DRAFT_440970 [Alternaria rosae]KAH6868525.1 hypothetical protein BKA58DRAFT_440970 [Alternaria rosae]
MTLTHNQIGAIVSSCAGAVLLTTISILIFVHPARRYAFSRRKSPHSNTALTTEDLESQHLSIIDPRFALLSHFETIGNLVIPPNHRPLPSALDIINRVAMAIALPAGTKPANLEYGTNEEAEEKESWSSIERQDSLVMRESAAKERKTMSENHMEQLEKLQNMFAIDDGDGDEDEDEDDAESADIEMDVTHILGRVRL